MRNKPTTIALFANAYDNELKTDPHSKLEEGTYSVGNDRISFLIKKGEGLVLDLNIQHINSIAIFNQSVIQIRDHNMTEVKNKIYAFSKKSNDKSYWETLAEII